MAGIQVGETIARRIEAQEAVAELMRTGHTTVLLKGVVYDVTPQKVDGVQDISWAVSNANSADANVASWKEHGFHFTPRADKSGHIK